MKLQLKHPTGNDCTSTSIKHQNKWYKFCHDSKSWDDAQTSCQSLSGYYDLVVIDSLELNLLLSEQGGFSNYWIGLSDKSTEGSFEWTDGSVLSIDNWASGNPDNYVSNSLIHVCEP